jgi:hypothetical protein
MMRNLFRRAYRGSSWVMVLLIAVAFMIFGNMLLKMFFSIAMSAMMLAVNVAIFLFIVMALFFAIRVLSGSKVETK